MIVAAVNGPAFGGGLALACAADIRLASDSATFCSAFIRIGLSATDIGITYLLPKLIGNSRAFDLILTGRDIDAAEALQMGLVSKMAPGDELEGLALPTPGSWPGTPSPVYELPKKFSGTTLKPPV